MAQEKPSEATSQGDPAHQQQGEPTQLNAQQLNSELAKAFQELARGEQTATALESRLDDIEGRIEQLLASVEQNAAQQGASRAQSDLNPSSDPSNK